MARIVISSAGTMGDFVPFVSLGKRLRHRGHRVLMAINPAMLPLADQARLEAIPCGRTFGSEDAGRRAIVFDHWTRLSDQEIEDHWRAHDIDRSYSDLTTACRGADLLVASSLQAAAPMVHERSGIPWITVSLLPMHFPHADQPAAPGTEQDSPLMGKLVRFLNQIRSKLGFAELSPEAWSGYGYSSRLIVLASSPHFSRPLLDGLPQARMTGFWFDDDRDEGPPDLDPALLDFLDVAPAPLVLTFSSLPVRDAPRVVALHIEAAARLGRRLLIQRGWARLDREALAEGVMPGAVRFAGSLPHAWLFPRAGAVIHHGGVGTTAQAMRCGRPMLVEPYGNDQFFNARRVLRLGVGAAMHPHKLTLTGLCRILDEKVLTADVRRNALELGERLQVEDGLAVACELIEQQLHHGAVPNPDPPLGVQISGDAGENTPSA
jgi:UDP:flavonoid glycosyltransferase YjiC (YdhE family)